VERASGQGLVAVVRVGQRGQHRRRRRRGVEELAAAGQLGLAAAVAEQSIVADALEAVGQDVQQKASDELVGVEGHDLAAIVVSVVLSAKGDGAVPDLGQAGVGDGDAVGVAAEVVEHLLWPAKGRLGVDDPVDAARRLQLLGKASSFVEVDEGSAEDQLTGPKGLVESLKEQQATQPGAADKDAKRSKPPRGVKRNRDAITAERVLKASVPAGSRFKGYEDILVRDLRLSAEVIRYRRER